MVPNNKNLSQKPTLFSNVFNIIVLVAYSIYLTYLTYYINENGDQKGLEFFKETRDYIYEGIAFVLFILGLILTYKATIKKDKDKSLTNTIPIIILLTILITFSYSISSILNFIFSFLGLS